MGGVLGEGTQCEGDAHDEESYHWRPAALLRVEALKGHDKGEAEIHNSLEMVSKGRTPRFRCIP